jgi:hypothetical protein
VIAATRKVGQFLFTVVLHEEAAELLCIQEHILRPDAADIVGYIIRGNIDGDMPRVSSF